MIISTMCWTQHRDLAGQKFEPSPVSGEAQGTVTVSEWDARTRNQRHILGKEWLINKKYSGQLRNTKFWSRLLQVSKQKPVS